MQISDVIKKNQRLLWALQFIGWGAWAATFYLGVAYWGPPPTDYPVYLAVIALIGMGISLLLLVVFETTWETNQWIRSFSAVVAIYLAGVLWIAVRSLVFYEFYPEEWEKLREGGGPYLAAYFKNAMSAGTVMLVWSAVFFGLKYYLLNQEEKRRYLIAVGQAHEAQLKMLRYQLNPHFLFNTLNAISTLILDKETETANHMVTKLSKFLRYSLDNDPMQQVTVAEEMETLRLYLDIEKVRFDERLSLSFDVDERVSDALMPSLLLQPLVENSIKYAISQSIHGGSIAVSASVEGGMLALVVADDGPGLDLNRTLLTSSSGVGLANTQDRLRELYGSNQHFRLSDSKPHGLTITIGLPLEYAGSAKP